MSIESPKRRSSSARTMAVISSGDQEGPHPPLKHAVADGMSKTWMVTRGSVISTLLRCCGLVRGNGSSGTRSDAYTAPRAKLATDLVPVRTRVGAALHGHDSALWTHATCRAPRRLVAQSGVDSHDAHWVAFSSVRCRSDSAFQAQGATVTIYPKGYLDATAESLQMRVIPGVLTY